MFLGSGLAIRKAIPLTAWIIDIEALFFTQVTIETAYGNQTFINGLGSQLLLKKQIKIPFDVGRRCLFNGYRKPEKKVFQPIQVATYALSGVVFSLQIPSVVQYGLGEVHGALPVRYAPLL